MVEDVNKPFVLLPGKKLRLRVVVVVVILIFDAIFIYISYMK